MRQMMVLMAALSTATAIPVTWGADTGGPLKLGTKTQLCISDDFVATRQGVRFAVQPGKKHPANPLIPSTTDDKSAEWRLPYLYGTILRDPASGLFKMWYQVWAGAQYEMPRRICYATSKDGIHWDRPTLGLFAYKGSKANNIIDTNASMASVMYTPGDPDPNRRYRMFTLDAFGTRDVGWGAKFSPDGIHWKGYPKVLLKLNQVGDVAPTFYDEQTRQYVSFTKIFVNVGGAWRRTVGLSTSPDFLTWTVRGSVLQPDPKDDVQVPAIAAAFKSRLDLPLDPKAYRVDYYGMGVQPTGGVYVGFPWALYILANTPPPDNNHAGPVNVQLAVSNDLYHWKRSADRSPAIPWGRPGEWDSGCIYTAARPLVVGDEVWLYYGAENVDHGSKMHIVKNAYIDPKFKGGIGLAVWKRDRFSAVVAPGDGGTLVTVPLTFAGRRLLVNADVSGGGLKVELQDAAGRALPGYGLTESDAIQSDGLDLTASWRGQSDLSALAGKPVRIRFHLNKAKLFAFRFATD